MFRPHLPIGPADSPHDFGRRAPVTAAMKHFLGHTLFGSRLETVLLRKAAVVVAFHRVHESTDRNALSIEVDMFERYCRFFRRHFRVVSLKDIVERLESGL